MKSGYRFAVVLLIFSFVTFPNLSFAQSKTNDIPVSELPGDVKGVLDVYIALLRKAKSLDEVATGFSALAGGSLVNEDGKTLRSNVTPYSLKKDFENIKFYANPTQITRVNYDAKGKTSGFGPSAIQGGVYKIWINKAEGANGIPAPISIMVPAGHKEIKTPKIISIGSF